MADKQYKLKLRLSNGNDIDAGTFTVPQGEKGDTGKTAYDYAKDGGYAGTEAQFAAKLAEEPPAETDPTVPAWAKQDQKPAYGWDEITDKPFTDGKLNAECLPDDIGGGSENAVEYIEQTLTEEQKAQARENIGAASNDHSHNFAPTYTYGTDDLEAGVSPLAEGTLYFVYE